jgi:hypothetical protein
MERRKRVCLCWKREREREEEREVNEEMSLLS